MEKKRIGKTLKIRWAILTGGEPEPLAGRDLTLEISSGNRVRTTLSFVADGNVAAFVFEGSEQRYVGPYTVTMWENLGKEGQTVVDRCDAFCLVARSCEEVESGSAEDQDLEIESLDLGTSNFEAGVPGASAYELFKKHNPDSELTEEEYAEAPVHAAGAALAMVEQLEETEAAMKQAEQLRKQAEQGREASEQARATAEQGRVAAEQQRTLAEQTRVTNESARQTAEAGRQAAETKREENTAEAIRNSEEATRNAEDEAARVRMLADNPPKIVEVEGAKYWAFWDEETGQYVVSENRADVGDAVLFSPQALTPQQQEQARKNIGVQTEYVFEDIPTIGGRAFYPYNDKIYYVNSSGRLCVLDEQTFHTEVLDIIIHTTLPFNNAHPSCKRFIVRDGKILTFSTNTPSIAKGVVLYDLKTLEPEYVLPVSDYFEDFFNSGFFIEFDDKIFVTASYDQHLIEIDFATGSIIKDHSDALGGLINNTTLSYFSYRDDSVSLFVMANRIIKYDIAEDQFSVLIDPTISNENINVTKGLPIDIYSNPAIKDWLWIFNETGMCSSSLSDILAGKYNSTKYHAKSSDNFYITVPFSRLNANIFISTGFKIEVINHTSVDRTALSNSANINYLGYCTKCKFGVIYNRANGYYGIANDPTYPKYRYPVYRRYEEHDIH